mmetsp:Transcript_7955/g.20537  ORF Transcript_7955/g.20537 Transcript_7955/m.20537 type:complete len:259 (-) Transcript_7955:1105-1881(-)
MHQQRRAQLRDAALRAAAGRGGKPERGRPEDCGRQGAVVARQHALLVRRAGGGAPCARPFAHRRRHHHHRFRRQLWAAGRGLWDGSSARGAYRRRSMCRRCSALGQRADMRGASWERWWCPRAGVGGCGAAQGGVPPRAQSVCVHAEPQGENAAGGPHWPERVSAQGPLHRAHYRLQRDPRPDGAAAQGGREAAAQELRRGAQRRQPDAYQPGSGHRRRRRGAALQQRADGGLQQRGGQAHDVPAAADRDRALHDPES